MLASFVWLRGHRHFHIAFSFATHLKTAATQRHRGAKEMKNVLACPTAAVTLCRELNLLFFSVSASLRLRASAPSKMRNSPRKLVVPSLVRAFRVHTKDS